jgi:predicted glutamine amidotransferase
MCRMMGVVSLPTVQPQFFLAFRELATHGRYLAADGPCHLDGWGAGWFGRDAKPQLRKAAVPVLDRKSGYFDALASVAEDRPQMAIAHVRKASTGSVRIEDTHPFEADGWLFCHNGTLSEYEDLPLHHHRPRGGTDSERLFLYLLEHMAGGVEQAVRRVVETVPRDSYTSLTFLLTNGHVLVAYRDVGRPEETPKESARYYTLYALLRDDTCIVCSEPLPYCGQPWRALDDGELLIASREARVLRQVNIKERVKASVRT